MRVTGGKARGIPLRVPSGPVRPATDYLREAVFSSLAAWVPSARVLDLFAGTGAYALECLSRGASSAVAVDRMTAEVIRGNAAAVVPYIFMLVVLVVRPTGMFGWKRIERV